jgi:hypothetical protein
MPGVVILTRELAAGVAPFPDVTCPCGLLSGKVPEVLDLAPVDACNACVVAVEDPQEPKAALGDAGRAFGRVGLSWDMGGASRSASDGRGRGVAEVEAAALSAAFVGVRIELREGVDGL